MYLGFLASYTSSNYIDIYKKGRGLPANNFLLTIYSFLYSFLPSFRFSVRYKVGIKFRFFKYLFYNKILVLLVLSYSKLKLLFSSGRYSY